MTELIKIEAVNAVDLFTGESPKIRQYMKRFQDEANFFVPDVTTSQGRNAIKSFAHKFSLSKKPIETAADNLTADWKAKVKQIDKEKKEALLLLDSLRISSRKPLTLWENKEKERKEAEAVSYTHLTLPTTPYV